MSNFSIETIAKLIATNYADWRSFTGKAKKVIKYIKSRQKIQKDLFL